MLQNSDEVDISFQVYDFRGLPSLTTMERVFYASNSMYLLVLSLEKDDISSLKDRLIEIKVSICTDIESSFAH